MSPIEPNGPLHAPSKRVRWARRIILAAATLLAATQLRLTPYQAPTADAPMPLVQLSAHTPSPHIAVVLGGGGPRGFAHLGVLQVLDEAGIKADLVVGTSIGAIFGSLYASGMSARDIYSLYQHTGMFAVLDPNPWADRGWVVGNKLQNFINAQLEHKPLNQLQVPLIAVTTERQSGQPRFFQTGNAGLAVRASAAIPGIFSPVGIGGVEYVDGDESLPVAVSAARQAGTKFVIAIDVSATLASIPDSVPEVYSRRDVYRRQLIDPELAKADFVFHVDLGYWAPTRPSYFEWAREQGLAMAKAKLPALQAQLKQQTSF